MDTFTKKKRSEIMSKIRSKDTKIEKTVFKELRKRKIYFQKYYSKVVGRPDIALPKKKKAVFIDGDFWHGYKFFKTKSMLPKKYWQAKIETNIMRDRKNRAKLKKEGWKVMRVWEHEIENDLSSAMEKLIRFLS